MRVQGVLSMTRAALRSAAPAGAAALRPPSASVGTCGAAARRLFPGVSRLGQSSILGCPQMREGLMTRRHQSSAAGTPTHAVNPET
ncbi:hypothetical protein T484DRAFT_2924252 [Baffinella frigidus]|nr:hypothetical protein T484DRAFT_2924252 [Cryptophyta sp. CCMP2293]